MEAGIESWAYHRRFGETYPWEAPSDEPPLDALGFIELAARLGARHVSLQTIFLRDGSPETARQLREAAAAKDVRLILAWGHPDGLRAGTDAALLDEMLEALRFAGLLEVDLVRIVCGGAAAYLEPFDARAARLRPMLRAAVTLADGLGLDLAVENHGDLRMVDLVALVEGIGSPRLGICFDNGNCFRVGDDPVAAATLAAPHVRVVHLKDLRGSAALSGDPSEPWWTVPLGEGDADPAATLDALGSAARTVLVELSAVPADIGGEDRAVREGLAFLRAYAARHGRDGPAA